MFTVNGIVNVVKFHGRVAYIRDEEIELLKKVEKCDEVVLTSNEEYKENDEVEIVEGMFAGYKGRVVDNGNKCKVVIRIEPIDYSLVVDVESKYVRLLVPVVV